MAGRVELSVVAKNQASAVLKQIGGDIAGLGKQSASVSQQFQNMGKSMTMIGAGLTAGVTAPLVGLGLSSINAAADMEQLDIAFTTMLGSASEAKKLMQDLTKFSAQTPFEMPEVVAAGRQLLAFGIEAKDIEPTLRQLGDVAAGVGAPIGDLAYLFGTASASGRLMTVDINQFAQRGIPIISALADVMGVAESQVRDMAAEGKIGADEMKQAFAIMSGEGGKFAGLMAAQSQSIKGLFSTVKDNVGQTLIVLGNQIIETFDLRRVLGDAIGYLEQMRGVITDLAANNPTLFKMAIGFGVVAAAIGPVVIGIGMVMTAIGAAMPVLAAMGGALSGLALPFAAVGAAAALLYYDVGGVRTLLVSFGQDVIDFANITMSAMGNYRAVIADAGAGSIEAAEAIGMFPPVLQGAVGAFDSLLSSISTAWVAIQPQLMQLWSQSQILLPIAFSTLQTIASTAWSGISAAFSTAWGAIQPALSQLWTWTQVTLPIAFASFLAIAAPAWSSVSSTIATAWAAIQPVLTTLGTWVQTTLPAAFAALAPAASTAWTGISTAVSTTWGSIQPVLTQLWSWMQIVLPLSMSGISTSASTAWSGFSTAISSAWATVQGIFTQITATALGVAAILSTVFGPSITRLGQSISTAFAGLGTLGPQFTGLQTAISNMVTAVQPLLAALGQSVAAVFGIASIITINFFSAMFKNLPAIIGVAIDQLTLTFNTIATTMTAVVGVVSGVLSGDFAGAWQSAQTLVSGAVSFMTGSLANLSLVGVLAFGALKTFITTTFSDLASLIGIDDITAKLQEVQTTISTFFTGEGNIFSTAFNVVIAAPEWLATLTAWVWPEIEKLAADWWPEIAKLAADWWPALPDFTWPDMPEWAWPSLPEWAWPTLPRWSWPAFPSFRWPSIPMPDWVSSLINWRPALPSWLGGDDTSTTTTAGNAIGTSSWRGGMTWVGETGPELVSLPPRSRIFNPAESLALAGAGGGDVYVTVNATVANDIDVQRLAYQISDILRKRR